MSENGNNKNTVSGSEIDAKGNVILGDGNHITVINSAAPTSQNTATPSFAFGKGRCWCWQVLALSVVY